MNQSRKHINDKSAESAMQNKVNTKFLSSDQFSVSKILVPTDLSKLTEAAMIQAASIAKKCDSQIMLIHLFGTQSRKPNLIINITDLIAEKAQQTLNIMLSDFREKYPELDINGVCEEGDMISGINDAILHYEANLVIMGIDANSLTDVFSGKYTSLLLSEVIVPVLIVSPESKNISPHEILLVSEKKKLNHIAIDSSKSMVNKVFGNADHVFFSAVEQENFAIDKMKYTSSSSEIVDDKPDLTKDSLNKNKIAESNLDLLVFMGKKRKTWTRFLKSQTGVSLTHHFNALILIWAGQ